MKKRKKLLILCSCLAFLLISCATILAALAIIKPNVKLSFVKNSNYTVSLDKVNRESELPLLYLKGDSVKIELNGKTHYSSKNYRLSELDFTEGTNNIKLTKYIDIFFAKIYAKESKNLKIEFDRTSPQIEFSDPSATKYSLIDDYTTTIKSSENVDIFVINQSSKKKLLEAKSESNLANLKIPSVNGENKLEIYAIDKLGNESEKINLNAFVYKPKGYTKATCAEIIYPYNTTIWQYGLLDYGTRLPCEKIDNKYFVAAISPKGSKIPCSGPCDANVNHIRLITYQGGKNDALKNVLFINKKITSKSYTTKAGIKGELIDYRYDEIGLVFSYRIFLVEKNGKTYMAVADLSGGPLNDPLTNQIDNKTKSQLASFHDYMVIK